MKILIAADGSAYTKRMLAFIAAHDEWLGPQHSYTVLHCVPAIPHRAAASWASSRCRRSTKTMPRAVFKPIRSFFKRHHSARRLRPPYRFRRLDHRQVRGPTKKFDLIILGTHGHGAVAGLVMGSVGDEGDFALQYSCAACSVDPLVGGAFLVERPGLAAA